MALPKTAQELEATGYASDGSGECRACHAAILWYRTPKGKRMPLDRATLEPHWSTCPDAGLFRKGK